MGLSPFIIYEEVKGRSEPGSVGTSADRSPLIMTHLPSVQRSIIKSRRETKAGNAFLIWMSMR